MNEIDNHADTICAGPNWTLLELSGEYCNVSPFSTDYQPKQNVPIARCATTYTCPTTGDCVVLVADQVLWFGDELHCSLINPHQIRYHGYGVCDDPWDPHRSLGIDLDSIFIPLKTLGPNLFFESSVPTAWDLENLPIIEITSSTWNPADLQMLRPQLHPNRVVDCISTARRDICWSQSTAFTLCIIPVCHCSSCARCTYGDGW
jgi:hypothetical protein